MAQTDKAKLSQKPQSQTGRIKGNNPGDDEHGILLGSSPAEIESLAEATKAQAPRKTRKGKAGTGVLTVPTNGPPRSRDD